MEEGGDSVLVNPEYVISIVSMPMNSGFSDLTVADRIEDRNIEYPVALKKNELARLLADTVVEWSEKK